MNQSIAAVIVIFVAGILTASGETTGPVYRVYGRVLDGGTTNGLLGVEVQMYYSPLTDKPGDESILATAKTDANGRYAFESLPGELEGHVRILELPAGRVAR